MSTIQKTDNVTAASIATAAQAPKNKDLLSQGDFLKLMIAQMKNQDPSQPLDGQEYLGQLAQFSTLNSIQELQKSFDGLAQALTSFQTTQATNLVGQQVLLDGDKSYYVPGSSLSGEVTLSANTTNLKLKVYSESGELINTIDMGAQSAGQVPFSLSSESMSAGVYRVVAEGSVDGKGRQFSTQMWNWVESVSVGQGGQSSNLKLAGNLGNTDMNSIRGIR